MAQIRSLTKIARKSRVQEKIDSGYNVFISNGKRYFQITTWGTDSRQMKGSVSQTIQFNEESILQLIDIIRREMNV